MALTRSWLAISLPLAVAALALLAFTVRSLLGTVRGSVVQRVPLRAEQPIDFAEGGEYALNLESDSRTARTALGFTLADAARGAEVPLHRAIVRTRVSSLSRVRLELYRLTIPAPGAYVLRIAGASAEAAERGDAILFTRPRRAAIVVHVLALVACGAVLIGSIVLSGLVLSGGSARVGRQNDGAGSADLRSAIAGSAAVIRARTEVDGGPPRFVSIETWRGAVPSDVARGGSPEGLLVDLSPMTSAGYRPTSGEEVILVLNASPARGSDRPATVTLGTLAALLTVRGERATLSGSSPGAPAEVALDEVRRLSGR